MSLYPEMTAEDLISHAALMAAIVRQNYRLRACFPDKHSTIEMEIENFNLKPKKAPSVIYRASVKPDKDWIICFDKTNPIEAVDGVMKEAGITKVQQYIDLKNLTDSLNKDEGQ